MRWKSKIALENITVDVVRKGIKNLHLKILRPEGRILVSAPFFVSDAAIKRGLQRKMPWIKRKLEEFAKLPKQLPAQMTRGERHYFLGEAYELNFSLQGPMIDRSTMQLHVKPGENLEKTKHYLDSWYRQELHKLIPPLLDKWQPILGVDASRFSIKKMRTRWGSCNTRSRRISLNLELVKKPPQCLEYVLVHELVHLLERLHNKRFWSLMDRFMPDWRHHRELLNKF